VVRADRGEAVVPVDLVAVVDAALSRNGAELAAENIRVERQLAAVPPVRGNAELLEEAVRELITNARRAMPAGGTLTLATSSPDPRLVVLRVTDTGSGIAPDIIGRIFDPFFTTKASWRSTGFGLTLVHKIVSDHGGRIDVESQVGHGATFTLSFPVEAPAHLA
jgi:signal transduction histidine kinase